MHNDKAHLMYNGRKCKKKKIKFLLKCLKSLIYILSIVFNFINAIEIFFYKVINTLYLTRMR